MQLITLLSLFPIATAGSTKWASATTGAGFANKFVGYDATRSRPIIAMPLERALLCHTAFVQRVLYKAS